MDSCARHCVQNCLFDAIECGGQEPSRSVATAMQKEHKLRATTKSATDLGNGSFWKKKRGGGC